MPLPRVIERIAAPAPDVFRRDYLATRTPVIMTGLFSSENLNKVRTEEQARESFGWLRLQVATEYLTALYAETPQEEPTSMRLDEYLDLERQVPGRHRMCSEQPTPHMLMNPAMLPPYDAYEDAASFFFVGHAGQHAHMHFDGDYRHVLFHQVFGSKRFVLATPERNELFPAVGNFAEWSLENFCATDMERFLEFTAGVECTLHAGETLLIPASLWHFVDYSTTSLSFNLRFGRNARTRFLAENLHLSKWTQALAWMLGDELSVTPEMLLQFDRLKEGAEQHFSSAEERYDAMEQRLRECFYAMSGIDCPRALSEPEVLRKRYRAGSITRYEQLHPAPGEKVSA